MLDKDDDVRRMSVIGLLQLELQCCWYYCVLFHLSDPTVRCPPCKCLKVVSVTNTYEVKATTTLIYLLICRTNAIMLMPVRHIVLKQYIDTYISTGLYTYTGIFLCKIIKLHDLVTLTLFPVWTQRKNVRFQSTENGNAYLRIS